MDNTGSRRESLGTEEKRVRRESLGKGFEKKLNIKPEFSIQRCKEEIALYSAQIEKFFEEESGLSSVGLNPKVATEVAFITDADVEDLFGKCTKLRTTNTFLNPSARKDLMELYSKIYGSPSVTNNEFAGWLVKGYIATQVKKKKVNWALAASTTATEKADRAHRLLLQLLNPKSSDDATGSSFRHSSCTSQQGGISGRNTGALVKAEGAEGRPGSTLLGLGFRNLCPYGVSSNDLDVVRGVSELESELLVIATSKVKYVEADYNKISDKLVEIKFTMDDRRITAKEDKEKVRQVQLDLERAAKAVLKMELQASGISVGSAEQEDFAQKLGVLRGDRDSAIKRLDVSRFVAESSRDRAMKGADIYQDIEEEQMRAESDLEILRREIVEIKRHAAAVEDQRLEMEKRGGVSMWPKPALHPAMADDLHDLSAPSLQLHPCVFCNRGYPYFDIVIASCKHIYHIFCAAALAKVENRCTRCAEMFHPHWWQNFGFRGAYSGFEEEKERLDLSAKEEELRQSLKQNGSHHVMNWSQSSLQHSDWGSSGSIQRSCDLVFGIRSAATAEVHRLPSLASFSPSEEPDNTDIGLTVLNSRLQEVDSPVKNHKGNLTASEAEGVSLETVVVAIEGHQCENSEVGSDSQLLDIPKLTGTLLKRPSDLPFDNEDGRKKIALNCLEEKVAHMASDFGCNAESIGQKMVECRPLNSSIEKDKSKAKSTKRKVREQPPCVSASRVATRAETKKR